MFSWNRLFERFHECADAGRATAPIWNQVASEAATMELRIDGNPCMCGTGRSVGSPEGGSHASDLKHGHIVGRIDLQRRPSRSLTPAPQSVGWAFESA
ncbi:MAG: hypothetical protein DRJ50_00235 [Actinobacteria bacterium]|nr:MAG: hypothetical protein DRJ50_00235 [Actinomycetota bacterium]